LVRRFLDYIIDGESLWERRLRDPNANPEIGILGGLGLEAERAAARLLVDEVPRW
jgi:hypothetical protein